MPPPNASQQFRSSLEYKRDLKRLLAERQQIIDMLHGMANGAAGWHTAHQVVDEITSYAMPIVQGICLLTGGWTLRKSIGTLALGWIPRLMDAGDVCANMVLVHQTVTAMEKHLVTVNKVLAANKAAIGQGQTVDNSSKYDGRLLALKEHGCGEAVNGVVACAKQVGEQWREVRVDSGCNEVDLGDSVAKLSDALGSTMLMLKKLAKVGGDVPDIVGKLRYLAVSLKEETGTYEQMLATLIKDMAEANLETALKQYVDQMAQLCGKERPHVNAAILLREHIVQLQAAVRRFKVLAQNDGEDYGASYLMTLERELEEMYKCFVEQNDSKRLSRRLRAWFSEHF